MDPSARPQAPFATIEISRETLRHAQRHEVPYELAAWERWVLTTDEDVHELVEPDERP